MLSCYVVTTKTQCLPTHSVWGGGGVSVKCAQPFWRKKKCSLCSDKTTHHEDIETEVWLHFTRRKWVRIFSFLSLVPSRNSVRHQLDWRPAGPQGQVRTLWEWKSLIAVGNRIPNIWSISNPSHDDALVTRSNAGVFKIGSRSRILQIGRNRVVYVHDSGRSNTPLPTHPPTHPTTHSLTLTFTFTNQTWRG